MPRLNGSKKGEIGAKICIKPNDDRRMTVISNLIAKLSNDRDTVNGS